MAANDRKKNTRASSVEKIADRLAANVKALPKARKEALAADMGDLASIIRQEIARQGWSARQLGIETGIPQPTVTRFIGGADIRLETATKLCRALGLQLTVEKP